jgi:hypothetical protein
MSDQLAKYRALKQSCSRQEFTRKYEQPFFLRRATVASSPRRDDWADPIEFNTKVGGAVYEPDPGSGDGEILELIPIEKASGNPYADLISIGRAKNCDIVLRHNSVSKLHAYLTVLGPELVKLVDSGSANGTTVNGNKAEPKMPLLLTPDDTVVFGEVSTRLVSPDALYQLL